MELNMRRSSELLIIPAATAGRSIVLLIMLAMATAYTQASKGHAESSEAVRGQYLVRLGGCTDCHTPGHLL